METVFKWCFQPYKVCKCDLFEKGISHLIFNILLSYLLFLLNVPVYFNFRVFSFATLNKKFSIIYDNAAINDWRRKQRSAYSTWYSLIFYNKLKWATQNSCVNKVHVMLCYEQAYNQIQRSRPSQSIREWPLKWKRGVSFTLNMVSKLKWNEIPHKPKYPFVGVDVEGINDVLRH